MVELLTIAVPATIFFSLLGVYLYFKVNKSQKNITCIFLLYYRASCWPLSWSPQSPLPSSSSPWSCGSLSWPHITPTTRSRRSRWDIFQGHTNIQGLRLNEYHCCLKLTDPILGIPCMAAVHRGTTFRLISSQETHDDGVTTDNDTATPLMSPLPRARYDLGQYPQLYPAHSAPSAPPDQGHQGQFYPSLQWRANFIVKLFGIWLNVTIRDNTH